MQQTIEEIYISGADLGSAFEKKAYDMYSKRAHKICSVDGHDKHFLYSALCENITKGHTLKQLSICENIILHAFTH